MPALYLLNFCDCSSQVDFVLIAAGGAPAPVPGQSPQKSTSTAPVEDDEALIRELEGPSVAPRSQKLKNRGETAKSKNKGPQPRPKTIKKTKTGAVGAKLLGQQGTEDVAEESAAAPLRLSGKEVSCFDPLDDDDDDALLVPGAVRTDPTTSQPMTLLHAMSPDDEDNEDEVWNQVSRLRRRSSPPRETLSTQNCEKQVKLLRQLPVYGLSVQPRAHASQRYHERLYGELGSKLIRRRAQQALLLGEWVLAEARAGAGDHYRVRYYPVVLVVVVVDLARGGRAVAVKTTWLEPKRIS